METWRVVDTGLLTGAENITYDRVILDARAEGLVPNTFRFLRFNPPVALVGYHQSIEQEIRISYCIENNIDINRRITGGGAIYFSPEHLGWEVFAQLDGDRFPYKVDLLYKRLCNAAVKGLRKLGLNARFRPKNDIEIGHRKISGTGGTSNGGAFMFQGTLLVDLDINKMLRALRVPVKKLSDKEIDSLKDRVTTIKWELGYTPSYAQIKEAILEGFSEEFKIVFEEQDLTEFERKEFLDKLPYFNSKDWVYGIRSAGSLENSLFTLRKTPGGLVKLALSVDVELNSITSAFITGDFFAYPPGVIYDFEAGLKHIHLDMKEINNVLKKLGARDFQIPGVKLNDFRSLFQEAVERVKYTRYGLTLSEINNIFLVNRKLDYFIDHGVDTLLLPYCSKLLSCKFRHSEGCTICDQC
ncbi:MAG: lipoate protein ligase C-terminal domain-containing protein, partial [Candidatus Odinarchaeota archaeon]